MSNNQYMTTPVKTHDVHVCARAYIRKCTSIRIYIYKCKNVVYMIHFKTCMHFYLCARIAVHTIVYARCTQKQRYALGNFVHTCKRHVTSHYAAALHILFHLMTLHSIRWKKFTVTVTTSHFIAITTCVHVQLCKRHM